MLAAAARPGVPIPLVQYVALLDLSFSLGFRTDALARLRERHPFEYIDHAMAGRPREADRSGRQTLSARGRDRTELLRLLELDGDPPRQSIVAAYRRVAARHHPDRFHEASEREREEAASRFIEVTRAYEELLAGSTN